MRRRYWVVFLMTWVVQVPPVDAVSETPRRFEELVDRADVVLVGTVSDQYSAWGEGALADYIFTYYRLTRLTVLKGRVSGDDYVLRMSGGRIGDAVQLYQGAPRFEPGQTYTLFIKDNFRTLFPLVGVKQGVYRVRWDPVRREYTVVAQGTAIDEGSGRPRKSVDVPVSLSRFIEAISRRVQQQ